MNLAVLDEGGQWLVEEHPPSLEVLGCPLSSIRVAKYRHVIRQGLTETINIHLVYVHEFGQLGVEEVSCLDNHYFQIHPKVHSHRWYNQHMD